MQAETLSDYLSRYADTLIAKVETQSRPLVAKATRPSLKLLRQPMEAQWDRIQAVVAGWRARRKGMILSAEMGTGKTICAIVATHAHANSRPYRALVVCPPHLQHKWVREIEMTLPGARCRILSGYKDVLGLKGTKPSGPEWLIISGNKAKMASSWIPSFRKKSSGILHCPSCDSPIERKVVHDGADVMVPSGVADLQKHQTFCKNCSQALFQWTHEYDRWPIANLVSRQARGVFRYLILDEAHEAKGERTSIGLATGKLASAIPYKLALTGTLLNGYADSVLPLSYRLFPKNLKEIGIQWGDTMAFTKRYGRIETIVSFRDYDAYANRQSRGGGKTTTTRIRPGIVPSLYGDCLLENTVFCALDDLGYKLPGLKEVLHSVEMDQELAENYDSIEQEIKSSLRSMIASGSKAAISILLNTLNGWPDHPYGFSSVGYHNADGQWFHVTDPPDLSEDILRNKEQKLIEIIRDSVSRGRQVWVYVEMTIKHDVQIRLEKLLRAEGLDVRILRSTSVRPAQREEWIRANAKANVVISNPALVKTGLDLFDRSGSYNFSTLVFYQTGYQLDTLRQAAARSNRIGQWLDCEVHYLFYADTMQESCVSLMAKKASAAQAIDGKLTTSGLAASSDEDSSAAMALAKMLISKEPSQSVVSLSALAPAATVRIPALDAVDDAPRVLTVPMPAPTQPSPTPVVEMDATRNLEEIAPKPILPKQTVPQDRPVLVPSVSSAKYVITEARMKQWTNQSTAIRQAFVASPSKARQMLRQLTVCLRNLDPTEQDRVQQAIGWEDLLSQIQPSSRGGQLAAAGA